MKILVLATNYSRPDGFVSSQYIHSRNKIYVKKGIDVSVISFGAEEDYVLDGVKVYTIESYKDKLLSEDYSILVSHAPNIKQHYLFIKRYGNKFGKIAFFFHGHEVLRYSKIYPSPYKFNKKGELKSLIIREIYDFVKLKIWKRLFTKIAYKSEFIFVSNWMYEMFINYVKIDPSTINDKKHIIYNCIGDTFEMERYDSMSKKKYDFVTVRNLLDESKYSIDIVTRIAENNPQYTFFVAGKGRFFDINKKPKNLIWQEKHLNHREVIDLLNKSKIALMPTRADAQGVMACEMATFGIPLITSNIDVCKEIFAEFQNVSFIDNEDLVIDLDSKYDKLMKKHGNEKVKKYFTENTIESEVRLFKKLVGN